MNIKTRLVAPLTDGDGPEHYEAFNTDIYDGKPGDMIGIGPTPFDAVKNLIEKIEATVAEAEATPPVDVHIQLRDAKVLLGRGVAALENVVISASSAFSDHRHVDEVARFHRDAAFFMLEHGQ